MDTAGNLLAHSKILPFLRFCLYFGLYGFCALYSSQLFLFHVKSLTISLPIRRQISMVFACQQDSFLRNFKTKVVSCKAGKLAGKDAYELILEDTVLFPEGGGQVGLLLSL